MIDTVYLSQKEKDQLLKLKRTTGIQNWNVLCRWAFCLSLAEESSPAEMPEENDHAIEMTWKVFGGQEQQLYLALLIMRCRKDNISLNKDSLSRQLRAHTKRGISLLLNNHKNGIINLFNHVARPAHTRSLAT